MNLSNRRFGNYNHFERGNYMATINIRSDIKPTNTLVPNVFIDSYMAKANGEFVKVYLYLLRILNDGASEFSISKIADLFEHTEKDIKRALNYWAREGLISVEYNSAKKVSGIRLLSYEKDALPSDVASAAVNTPVAEKAEGNVNEASSSTEPKTVNIQNTATDKVPPKKEDIRKTYSINEISSFKANEEFEEMTFVIEQYIKQPLSSTELQFVAYWNDEFHFHCDLIVYLVEYCITKGHSSLRYMDKVALKWAEKNISTVEEAKKYCEAHSKLYYAVIKALGINGRNLASSEINFLDKWSKEYGFDTEIITEACNRTISAIHQPSFEYTDSILKNWKNSNIKSIKDIAVLDESFEKNRKISLVTNDSNVKPKKNKFNNFSQRNQDFDQLEKIFLNSSVQ